MSLLVVPPASDFGRPFSRARLVELGSIAVILASQWDPIADLAAVSDLREGSPWVPIVLVADVDAVPPIEGLFHLVGLTAPIVLAGKPNSLPSSVRQQIANRPPPRRR